MVYFHLQPAIIDGLLTLLGVLTIMYLFRIRTPALRSLFLLIPLIRPPMILIGGASQIERLPIQEGMTLGLRIPDPFHLVPNDIFGGQERISTASALVARLTLLALLVGLTFLLFRWAGFVLFYHRLKKRAGITDSPEWVRVNSVISRLCREMGIQHLPRLLLLSHSKWSTPCTFGWRRPTIVFENELVTNLTDDELRAILAHELAHVLKRDGLWRWVSVLLRDIQCFNPFSHICMDKLELEREKACDSIAVHRAKVHPRMLATCLVKQSQILLEGNTQPFPGQSMSLLKPKRCGLEKRISFLLEMPATGKGKNFWESTSLGTKLLLALVLYVPFATLQVYVCIFLGDYALVIM